MAISSIFGSMSLLLVRENDIGCDDDDDYDSADWDDDDNDDDDNDDDDSTCIQSPPFPLLHPLHRCGPSSGLYPWWGINKNIYLQI